jgi:hypothetical protein
VAGPLEHDRPPSGSDLADPTRDIRLPPLPGTPPPVLPPGWEVGVRPAELAPEPVRADQPTDRLGTPRPDERHRTLTFEGTSAQRWAAGHAASPDPAWASVPPTSRPVVGARSRPQRGRRWPWIVLTLVPVLVIVITGVWLFVLVQGG